MSLKIFFRGVSAILCILYSQMSYAATYEYDTLGRLTKAIYKDGKTVEYSYDAAGNRTKYVVTASAPPPPSNNPPVANSDSATGRIYNTTNIYVLNNDTDPDGDALTVTSATPNGSFFCTVEASTYVSCFFPPGNTGLKTVNYAISDGNGGSDTGTITISVSY